MRDDTLARNYAEALFEVAQRHEGLEVFGAGINTVSALLDENPDFRLFLETPRVDADDKKSVIKKAFSGHLPVMLVNFLLVTIDKRRQRLVGAIAEQFRALVDEHHNRVHVEVTVAREMDDAALAEMGEKLSVLVGRTAIPHQRVRPEILGGVIVRTGDTIYDGSLRRRLDRMRRQLVSAGAGSAGAEGE